MTGAILTCAYYSEWLSIVFSTGGETHPTGGGKNSVISGELRDFLSAQDSMCGEKATASNQLNELDISNIMKSFGMVRPNEYVGEPKI